MLPRKDNLDFTPVAPADLRPPPQSSGSIYQSGYDVRLFEDVSARRVGDVLTVRLIEKTVAQKDANTDIQRDASTTLSVPLVANSAGKALLDFDFDGSIKSNNKFNGQAESSQNNRILGDISVTVVEVLPNGNLKIRGEKRVTLNQGNEYIRLSGIVRPVDIETTNTIPSTKVADATIMYTGDGAMADANRMGWLSRLLTSVLFPF